MASDIYVAFGADTGALEAAMALAKSQVQGMQRELASLANEMRKTGAAADSELGQKMVAMGQSLAAGKTKVAEISEQLKGMGAGASGAKEVEQSIKHVTEAAVHGHTGMAFYTREIHALMDEFSSGRIRQGEGTFLNLAFTTLQAHAALIPYAAAVTALGGILGYFAYQGYAAATAMKAIQLDAAVHQFDMTADAAAKLRDGIKLLADVGSSDAAEIYKPFAELGPVGAIIAQLASQHIPLLAKEMGKTLPEAAAEAAKWFTQLDTTGKKYIESSRTLTEEERRRASAVIESGDKIGGYAAILDAMSRSLSGVEATQRKAKEATQELDNSIGLAASTTGGFAQTEEQLAANMAAATARVQAQEEAVGRLKLQLASAADAAGHLGAALADATKVDKVKSEIDEAEGKVKEFQKALTETKDPESIDRLNRSLEITQDRLKKLRDEAQGGVLGGSTLDRLEKQNRLIDEQNQGPRSAQLKQELPGLQAAATDPNVDQKQREKAAEDASAMILKIRDAEFEETKAKDDERVIAAGKNSAQVIAIRQKEVADALRIYGDGNAKTIAAERELARAREQAANRGAAAGAKAAKDELGASLQDLQAQIQEAEKTAQDKIKIYELEAKAKQISEAEKLKFTKDALAEEKAAVDALYADELAKSGQTATKIAEIRRQLALFDLDNIDKVKEAEAQASAKSAQAWESATKTINGAFTSQINGLLTGTETWSKALKNVLTSLTEDVIKFFVDWGLQQAENAAKGIVLNNSVVTAHTAGDATMAAADQGAAGAGLGAMMANAEQAIAVDIKTVAAGVAAFLAPFLGPAAPAAGLAAAGGIGMMDIGAWNIPSDQLAMVHKGEMVATPSQAAGLRSLIENGGAPAGGHTFNHSNVFNVNGSTRMTQRDFEEMAHGVDRRTAKQILRSLAKV